MAPFSIEKQLILNRLGKTSLNKDAVELIKEFTFESWNNWCIRVEAERIKRITNKAIEDMSKWRTIDNKKWIVSFDVHVNKFGSTTIKEIGAVNCSSCGNYIQNFLYPGDWLIGGGFRPSISNQRCAPRAICQCVENLNYNNTGTEVEEEDYEF
tara:strand:- start:173 stop:634 length:462 start_codon:yes stop_codon:yes gene_type:complete